MDAAPETSAQCVNLCPETYEEVIVAPENLQSRQLEEKSSFILFIQMGDRNKMACLES